MKRFHDSKKNLFLFIFVCFIELYGSGPLFANPSGVISSQGVGSVSGLGTQQVIIQQTAQQAIINWKTFNIAAGEVTQFIQPSAQSIILNRITDVNPSQIFGSLLANGRVILLNPNGILFGPGAQMNVNGLIASTLDISDSNFLNGNYSFQGSGANGMIKNSGTIQTATGGFVYLFAPSIENDGVIVSPEGQIFLGAGNSAYLSSRLDGSGFLVQVTAPAGQVLNLSQLIANGGQISLYGAAVTQNGLIQADAVRDKNGKIELYASKTLELGVASRTEANGGDGTSQGGTVSAISNKSTGQTLFDQGAIIDISGGKTGGNGGSAEVSGFQLFYSGTVIGTAVKGYTGGALLLDPDYINLSQAGFDSLITGGNSTVTVAANYDINVTNVNSDLNSWAMNNPSGAPTLRFTAGNNINFTDVWLNNDGFSGTGIGPAWNFSAVAGANINLNRTIIQTGSGTIVLEAGGNIQLAGGSGGNYTYLWTTGGDIHINAGGDMIAPTVYDSNLFLQYSGIRLDGGNLFVQLGGNFIGGMVDGVLAPPGFILSNGTATIDLSHGGSFGSTDNYATITLGKGIINITTQNNIYLGNVQDQGLVEHDSAIIDPTNQVNLTSLAGDIYLKPFLNANVIPGSPNSILGSEVSIYPASFSAEAQQGNIIIESDLRFWPSLQGALTFQAWGNIEGSNSNQLTNLMLAWPDPSKIIGLSSSQINAENIFGDPTVAVTPDQIPTLSATSAPILFKTATGDIANFDFRFLNPVNQKDVTISAGRDLTNFIAEIGIPIAGSKALVSAGRNMIFANATPTVPFSGISFIGQGVGDVVAIENLDLGTSNGIEDHISNNVYLRYGSTASGMVNIGIGGDLLMTESKIWTYNGASIDIHGVNGPGIPVGGSVDVGSNAGTRNDLGIVTLRGGNIHIDSTGDVNVNLSRVATISGGNIDIASTAGSINAGDGSPDATVDFFFPVSYDFVKHTEVLGSVKVPGSGIFTFDKDDPNPLPPYPPLKMIPALKAEEDTIIKESFLGFDVSALKKQFVQDAQVEYAIQKSEFRKDWKLGDITLTAAQNVVVPPAGVRGKVVTIQAANLVLSGGQISGDLNLNVGAIQGNVAGITGPMTGSVGSVSVSNANSAGSSGLGSMSGTTGSVSTITASSAAVAPSPVQKSVIEENKNGGEGEENGGAGRPSNDEGRKKKGGKKFNLKQGVIIEVDTEELKENEKQPR